MVEVATYLGAAALGGIIGNRADAGTVATVQRMFKAIRDRRQERNTDDNAPLTREEAIEAATAAVLSQSLPVPASTDLRATRRPDGSWEITFYEDSANPVMVVTVPRATSAGPRSSSGWTAPTSTATGRTQARSRHAHKAGSPAPGGRGHPARAPSAQDAIENSAQTVAGPRGRHLFRTTLTAVLDAPTSPEAVTKNRTACSNQMNRASAQGGTRR
ncbi:hypothetical protein [Thermomonospora catenispora]|uniref:hypothetical protein n=1 Tax=Thermomonospora catenispora TaxID=2493090 RepID=UPI001123AC6D|nr:hypothetical protein [Thermomonospora catenispora]TNY37477.1 hypothetical protein EIO00_08470 [Thermomonospora catenispora]